MQQAIPLVRSGVSGVVGDFGGLVLHVYAGRVPGRDSADYRRSACQLQRPPVRMLLDLWCT